MAVNRTGGLYFDGIDDYVDCGNDSSLDITDEITISVWIKTQKITNTPILIVAKAEATSWCNNNYMTRLSTELKPQMIWGDGSSYKFHAAENAIQKNKWTHIVYMFDKIYINGEKQTLTTAGTATTRKTVTDNLLIGLSSIQTLSFKGIIDDIRIYNRELNAEEITRLYNGEEIDDTGLVLHLPMNEHEGDVCHDISGYDNHGTIYGARWVIKKSK